MNRGTTGLGLMCHVLLQVICVNFSIWDLSLNIITLLALWAGLPSQVVCQFSDAGCGPVNRNSPGWHGRKTVPQQSFTPGHVRQILKFDTT